MNYGRYVGHHNRHGSVLCLTADGLKVGSSYSRLPDGQGMQQKLQTEGWRQLKGLPWDVLPRVRQGHTAITEAGAKVTEVVDSAPKLPTIPQTVAAEQKKRGTFPVQKRYVEKYGFTAGCPGCNSIKHPIGQQLPHEPDCRAFIVGRILSDAGASLASRTQIDTFFSKEAQELIREKLKQKTEVQAADAAMQPAPAIGAGKLPVAKRTSQEVEKDNEETVEEVLKHGKMTYGGSSGSGLRTDTAASSKRKADTQVEDLRAETTDIEQLMDKVVMTNEPMPDASASTSADASRQAILAGGSQGSAAECVPSGTSHSAHTLDICYLEKIDTLDDFKGP